MNVAYIELVGGEGDGAQGRVTVGLCGLPAKFIQLFGNVPVPIDVPYPSDIPSPWGSAYVRRETVDSDCVWRYDYVRSS